MALRERGHEAVLAAPGSFAPAASEHGVEFAPLDEGPNRLMDDPVVRQAVEGGYRGVRGKVTAVRTARRIKPLMGAVLHDVGEVARRRWPRPVGVAGVQPSRDPGGSGLAGVGAYHRVLVPADIGGLVATGPADAFPRRRPRTRLRRIRQHGGPGFTADRDDRHRRRAPGRCPCRCGGVGLRGRTVRG
ncbi:hypothetical protein [Saccharothrix deserti]|uniref:hypothetical protein n=1 Tax=Saccharothrix deserti TaxID=2593674 RepID=UPI003083F93F